MLILLGDNLNVAGIHALKGVEDVSYHVFLILLRIFLFLP